MKQKYIVTTTLVLIVTGALAMFTFNYRHRQPLPPKQSCSHRLKTPTGDELCLELAQTASARARGLGGREFLPKNYGMLFVFDKEGERTFWMKGMLIPIDIIWINKDRQVVHVEENVPPPEPETPINQLKTYHSEQPALFVLEVQANYAREIGIVTGARIDLIGI